MSFIATFIVASITVSTWNLRWFPSGRAEHRASPRMEAAAFGDAADVIRSSIGKVQPQGKRILFLQEMRDSSVVSNLVAQIGDTNLVVAACSAFKERDGRLGWQQCAIVTDARICATGWKAYRSENRVRPPRGFAYALLDCGTDGLIACGCLHLKSNYGAGKNLEVKRLNITKRGAGAHQTVMFLRTLRTDDGRAPQKSLLVGDFNADMYAAESANERVFKGLVRDGYASCWEGVPMGDRITWPGHRWYAGSTLDYVFYQGFEQVVERSLAPLVDVSDHRFVRIVLK